MTPAPIPVLTTPEVAAILTEQFDRWQELLDANVWNRDTATARSYACLEAAVLAHLARKGTTLVAPNPLIPELVALVLWGVLVDVFRGVDVREVATRA